MTYLETVRSYKTNAMPDGRYADKIDAWDAYVDELVETEVVDEREAKAWKPPAACALKA